jgi:hypothetical protein
MHRKVAADVVASQRPTATLEIGAGTLNQLKFEPTNGEYDIVEPFKELFAGSPLLKQVRNVYNDISEIGSHSYNRITSIATFEHIMDLPFVVAKAADLLNPEIGHMRIGIPNEGTIMWKLGTRFTGFEFRKLYNLDYQVLMRYEHVNTASEIEEVLKHFFSRVSCSVFGLNRLLAFYRFYNCSLPRKDRVAEYLAGLTPKPDFC